MNWKTTGKLREISAEEVGAVSKDWGGRISCALIYPNTYFVGMSNLGVHHFYRLANRAQNIVCERAFLPDLSELKMFKREGLAVASIESQRSLHEFDLLAFTLPFENDVKNIRTILELSKIPLSKEERSRGRFPKLAIGGAAVVLNKDVFDEVFDVVSTGYVESGLKQVFDGFDTGDGLPDGGIEIARNAVWSSDTEFGSMHLVEVQRGCPNHCLFCAAPVVYRPFKEFSFDEIKAAICEGLPHRKKIGLVGGDVIGHPDFEKIACFIHESKATFSSSSIRADRVTQKIAELFAESGYKTVTLAPEAGNESLRKKIGKKISDDSFFAARSHFVKCGINAFKLYFMIGLPDETEKDILSIAEFVKNFKAKGLSRLSVTVNPFVPKSLTPFKDKAFGPAALLKERSKQLKELFSKIGGVEARFEPVSAAESQRHVFL